MTAKRNAPGPLRHIQQTDRPLPINAALWEQGQGQYPVGRVDPRTLDPHQRFRPRRPAGAAVRFAFDHGNIEGARREFLLEIGAHAADGFQARFRPGPVEAGKDHGYAPGIEIFRYADAQDFQVEVAGQGFHCLRGQGQQAPCVVNQHLAMLGHADVLPGSVTQQQRMPDQFFEFAHLLAYGGLGPVHAFGGAGEAAFVRHANEGLEQFEIEHGGLLIFDLSLTCRY
ncbi:hypothetical protein D3C84_559720 [compost metagenome]